MNRGSDVYKTYDSSVILHSKLNNVISYERVHFNTMLIILFQSLQCSFICSKVLRIHQWIPLVLIHICTVLIQLYS